MRSSRVFIKILFLVAVIFLLLFFSYPYFLKKLGGFLICEQSPQKADLIVVLNGRDTERSLAAVDLYNKGYSNLIVMSRGAKQPGSDEFWKRVGDKFNEKIFFQKAIEAMGVPEYAFKLIGDGVSSTYDEALATREFLKKNGYKSILLVTSKWHSKRAYLTFRSALKNDGIEIVIQPSRYDAFSPDVWWTNQNDAELVFGEYVKLIYYIVTLRINPVEILN
jgi:uncharacterized SAM-binding protein YcdF (DUF218 family)